MSAGTKVLLLLLSLLSIFHHGLVTKVQAFIPPSCSDDYGRPSGSDCLTLIDIIRGQDRRTHFMSLAGVSRPPGTNLYAWRNRDQLPIMPTTSTAPFCKVAVVPMRLRDGTIAYDTTHYQTISDAGNRVMNQCVNGPGAPGTGGCARTGSENNIAIALYEPGSRFDVYVQTVQAAGQPVVVDEDPDVEETEGIDALLELAGGLALAPTTTTTPTAVIMQPYPCFVSPLVCYSSWMATRTSVKQERATPSVTQEPNHGPGGHGDPMGVIGA